MRINLGKFLLGSFMIGLVILKLIYNAFHYEEVISALLLLCGGKLLWEALYE